jgi:hypothetical protein
LVNRTIQKSAKFIFSHNLPLKDSFQLKTQS